MFPADRQDADPGAARGLVSPAWSRSGSSREIGGGHVAAFEVLIANPAMRNLIREGKTHQIRNVIATGMKDGMKTLESSLSELVAAGLITYEEAVVHSLFPKEIRQPHEHAAMVARQQAMAS